jgi:sulfite exporter TauE/SafE
MAAFGAGTLPAMMVVAYLGQVISLPVRQVMRKAVPYFVVIMAVVLILRGLNLGIPYISPDMPAQSSTGAAIDCH